MRLATPDDAEAIHQLKLAAFGPFKAQYTPGCFDATVLDAARIRERMAQGPVWVVEDETLLGTLSAVRDDRGLYVRGMAVHPSARRRGIGQQLLSAAEAHARDIGAHCMWLSTTHFLTASQALYRAFGFQDAPGPSDLQGTALVSFEKRVTTAKNPS